MQMNGYGTRNLPNQPTMHSNAVYMNPGIQIHSQNQPGSKTNQQIPPPRPNMNGPNNYMSMPPTHMMMKQPIYYNNMMPYNMPLRNEGTLI